jgi:Ca2+-binding EF-hand superfamily protein
MSKEEATHNIPSKTENISIIPAKQLKDLRDALAKKAKFEELTKAVMKKLDPEDTGSIEITKLEEFFKNLAASIGASEPQTDDVKQVLNALDRDKSGSLNVEEFKVMLRDIVEAMVEDD